MGLKNIRKSAIVFITLLMVSFAIPSSFAAPDKDGRLSLIQDLRRSMLFLDMSEKVRQGASDIAIMYGGSSTGQGSKFAVSGNGSGFVVKDKKRNRFLILTAWHVMQSLLENPEQKIVHPPTKKQLIIKEVVAYSEKQDVFIGVLEDYTGRGLTLANSPNYNSNEMYILGFPNRRFAIHDGPGINSKATPFFGIITDTDKDLGGGSGGPVLNNEGQVVGIHQAGDSIHISKALKSEHFKDLLFGTNTSKADWEQAGFVVIEKPFKEAIKDIKISEHYRVLKDSPFSVEDNLPRLKQIADDGYLAAQLRMSWVLDNVDDPLRQEQIEDAIRYLKMAAQQKHAQAMISLSERLYEGNGIPQDKSEAANWFREIIKYHYRHEYTPTAMLNLAKMLYKGDDIPQNKKEAIKLYEQLEQRHDDVEVRILLAKMLEEGDSIPQNKAKAAQLYEQMIEEDGPFFDSDEIIEAKKRFAKMLEKGDGIPQDKKRARMLLKGVEQQQLKQEQRANARTQRLMERIRAEEEREEALSQGEPKPDKRFSKHGVFRKL